MTEVWKDKMKKDTEYASQFPNFIGNLPLAPKKKKKKKKK